jgi:hypothetical protein
MGSPQARAEANGCVSHMLQVLNAARQSELRIFYALHHRYRPRDYETWKYLAPIQQTGWSHKTFEYGTWGGEIRPEFATQPGDIVALEHWCSSGFANTDQSTCGSQRAGNVLAVSPPASAVGWSGSPGGGFRFTHLMVQFLEMSVQARERSVLEQMMLA